MALLRPHSMAPATIAFALAVSAFAPAAAQDLETEVRAVYLYNFARYFEWPAQAFPDADTPIRICVQAPSAFGDALERAVAGETINGRRIEAVRLGAGRSSSACHLYYVAGTGPRAAAALATLRGRPLLTVGEDDRFLDRGGMIRFRLVDNRVRFDINLGAVQRSGLRVSARLLGVANAVRRAP